jgi:hypothetical protein
VSYRISKDAKALARLKLEVIMHNRMGYRKPMILRRFHLDEMRRDTPYQMPKGQGRKPDMAVIERNKLYNYAHSVLRDEDYRSWDAFEHLTEVPLAGADEGFTKDVVSEYRKTDQKRDKLLIAEWHNILDPLPEAERSEILNNLLPHMRESLGFN